MLHLLAIGLSFISFTHCHTWIDQLSLIDSNNQPTGTPGFIRGYVQRLPGFTDSDDTYQLPSSNNTFFQDTDLMCKSTQTQGNQTNGPTLTAPGGSSIALRYLENGHITEPYIKPQKPNPGQVYVYATTQPSNDDTFTAIYGQWNSDMTGGDQRGYMMNATTFDDGECFQLNGSELSIQRNTTFGPGPSTTEAPNRWCNTIVTLNDENGAPLQSGTLITLYWVWDWPSYQSGVLTTDEGYTSCMDVQIQ